MSCSVLKPDHAEPGEIVLLTNANNSASVWTVADEAAHTPDSCVSVCLKTNVRNAQPVALVEVKLPLLGQPI